MDKKKGKTALIIAAVVLVVALLALLIIKLASGGEADPTPTPGSASDTSLHTPTMLTSDTDLMASLVYPASATDLAVALPLDLGEGLSITQIGYYNGVFTEDGSMDTVYTVLAVTLHNGSEKLLEGAELTLDTDSGEAHFSVQMLPAGASAILVELDKMAYSRSADGSGAQLRGAVFAETDGLETLELSEAESGITVTNTGETELAACTLYYRYWNGSVYLGGAAFEAALTGSLAAGASATLEIPGLGASHCRIVAADLS